MDLGRLRSFAEVAERGTVAAAASSLGFTAPAVSQHLAKLESELQTQLFDRSGQRLQLTDAGRALLPVAFDMLDLDARARHAVSAQPDRPHIVVAGFASAIGSLVVPRVDELAERMTFDLHEREDAEAMRDLRLGAVDVVLAQEYSGMPIERSERFDFTPLVTDQLRLVMPAGWSATTNIASLGDANWLLNGTDTRCAQATQQVLSAHGLAPSIVGTIADNHTLLELVAAGRGVTITPDLVLGAGHDGITTGTEDLGVSRTILAVNRTVSRPSLSSFLDVVRR